MKIALIYDVSEVNLESKNAFIEGLPPYINLFSRKNKSSISPPVPPLGLVLLATVLKNNGYDITIIDLCVQKERSKKILGQSNFDLIGIFSGSVFYDDLVKLAKLCRQTNPKAFLLTGGQMPGYHLNELIDKSIVDGVVIKEGEETILEIADVLKNKKELWNIPGLYTSKGFIERDFIKNLDNILPLPDWSLIDLKSYMPTLPVQTMRGCTHSCTYCGETTYWGKPVRLRSVKNVVNEIKNNVKRYRINTFRFVDSNFTGIPKRTKEICDAISKESLDIKWTSYARADSISEELVNSMVKSGCLAVDIGAESGSQKILNSMKKGYTPDMIRKAVKICKGHSLIVHTNFMLGFPGANNETMRETFNLIKELKPTTYCFNVFYLMPGSAIANKKEEYGIKGSFEEWRDKYMNNAIIKKKTLTVFEKELSKLPSCYYFFGGEHAANILLSLGYSKKQIIDVFRAFNELYWHDKKWALFHAMLSKLGIGRLKNFMNVVKDFKVYGAM